MFQNKFEQLLKDYPDAVSDKRKFMGLLKDYFPDRQMQVNLINTVHALGIVQDIQGSSQINNAFAYRYVKRMVDEFGVSRLNADWAVSIWCVCYGQNTLGKRCDIKISQAKSAAAPAIAEERPSVSSKQYGDLFCYTKIPEGYGVTGFSGQNKRTIIFSDRYNGLPVRQIMPSSFMECEVQEVVMTEGMAVIGDSAFKGCYDLKQVIFPYSLREIQDNAFMGCGNLITASLPIALEQIGKYAFSGTALKKINIPKTVYWLGEGAYADCKRLNNVAIPDNIISIPDRLFKGCEALADIKLSESIDSIGESAFENCTSLQNLVIPEAVKNIGENAFKNVHPKFTLLCQRLSVAEQYARSHDIRFQIIY